MLAFNRKKHAVDGNEKENKLKYKLFLCSAQIKKAKMTHFSAVKFNTSG